MKFYSIFVIGSLICGIYGSILYKNTDLVVLPDGTQLQGKKEGSVMAFKGLKFAETPIGKLRWAPPVMWSNPNISEVVDATKYGSQCLQHNGGGSEDCLFLNVFVNTDDDVTNSSVGIYIHGGAYTGGSSSLYEAADMVNYMNGRSIIVSSNYRLNVFGFLGSEQLRSQDAESGSTGNYGIQDQRLAFQWVQKNIASFGGDPNQVTIFGESAGAGSMSNHLTMPKSWGFFNKVALESGSFASWVTQNMSLAQTYYEMLLDLTLCEDIQCLMAMPANELFDISRTMESLAPSIYGSPWAPVADGVEATTHPWIALSNGAVADVPILHGTNTDEGTMFTALPKMCTEKQLESFWTQYGYNSTMQEKLKSVYLEQKYPYVPNVTKYYWAGMRELGDAGFSCSTKYAGVMLSNMDSHTSPSYLYHFEHAIAGEDYVPHTSEIGFVLHQQYLYDASSDWAMCDVMSGYWGNFIIDQDSNPSSDIVGKRDLMDWPPYSTENDYVMLLKDVNDMSVSNGLKQEECDLLIPYLDEMLRSMFSPV